MALLDLSSDLSRFRSEVSREEKNTPESSKATNNKNFATFQPITEKLSSFSPTINKPEQVKQLESKLSSTKLDDIRKFAQENLLMNSVSKYSSTNIEYSEQTLGRISTEQVKSRFNNIQQKEFVSNLYKSNIVILKPSGDKNTISPVDITINKTDSIDNIENPNLVITAPPLSIDRTKTSPNITKDIENPADNIANPNIVINKIPLTFQRDNSSPKIVINKVAALDNIKNPNIDILRKPISFDRKKQTPNIITETIKEGLIVNPNTDVIKIEQGTFHLGDESELNPDGRPIKFISESRLVNKEVTPKKDTQRYDGISEQLRDNSELNVDSVVKTIPYGRNEDPSKSKLSIVGTQSVNFFTDNNANGFVVNSQIGDSQYKEGSLFSWKGKSGPAVNFMVDNNAKGFQKFANIGETLYNTNSSKFGFTAIPEVDFFDATKKYTSEGFKKFTTILNSAYQTDASSFGWSGNSNSAPEVNYFDRESNNTNAGFHKFAQTYDTKYIEDSSLFDWDGGRENAPEVNYFDISGNNTNAGFHKFAQVYDSKYIAESSLFDWDGKRTDAPFVNYFDITGNNTNAGFHTFAQLYDTKYITDSSLFDWDGKREDAPEVNYFDISGNNTNAGFHKFAQIYDTKYVHESSRFDWDGTRENAPVVNYFDISGNNTTVGFHTFAQIYDTKYVHESSQFDWDGVRTNAPEVNYFDLTAKNTTAGFHRLAQLYDTKYVHESSRFDWDGKRENAPFVNYFDLNNTNTTKGFHTFAQIYDTKYVHESSRFDWDGNRSSSPEVNYFDISKTFTTTGFHRLAELYDTKYVKESSRFDWDGSSKSAPNTNFFIDKHGKGFTTFAEKLKSEYVKDISEFTFKGNLPKPVDFFGNTEGSGFVNKTEPLDSKYKKDISKFTFKGGLPKPVDFFGNTEGSGFVNKTPLLESKYNKDVSKFTFKGGLPTPVDFFANTEGSGFVNKTPLLESKYERDISRFTFKGGLPTPVDFFPNTSVEGFTLKIPVLESKYQKDISRFTFKGTRTSAPNVDYIDNTFATGFTKLIPSLTSEYITTTSKFTWMGSRSDAPSVDFFKLFPKDSPGVAGFNTFFTDKTETKYSDKLSLLSIESSTKKSPVRNVPYTTFFGYRPQERTGFMVNMSTFDGTLFPIISPKLKFDSDLGTRTKISIIRSEDPANLKTGDLENYAPLSLGKRPWANGTLFATLESQIPNVKTKAPAGPYSNKYERSLKDNTNKVGYLTKWATTRRSPSPLDEQYLKYKLQDESFNGGGAGTFGLSFQAFNQPYVVRGIQRRGEVENQRWGFGIGAPDDGIIRGGATVQAERILQDIFRIGKWSLSMKGILYNIRQLGLQLMNPVVDIDPDNSITSSFLGLFPSTMLYNPFSLIANVATARIGLHLPRHGLLPFSDYFLNKYERATRNRELKQQFVNREYNNFSSFDSSGKSRMIGLMKELLPNSFSPIRSAKSTTNSVDDVAKIGTDAVNKVKNISQAAKTPNPEEYANQKAQESKQKIDDATSAAKNPGGSTNTSDAGSHSTIQRVSSFFGGPGPFFGIGGTTIRRATHPYLTFYTTTPDLYDNKNPTYLDSAKRDTFYAATRTYRDSIINGDYFKYNGILEALVALFKNAPTNPSVDDSPTNLKDIIDLQKDTKDRIITTNPFDPRYDSITDVIGPRDKYSVAKEGTPLNYGPNGQMIDNLNPIKQYRTLAYNKLQKVKPGTPERSALFNDFRHDLEGTGSEYFVTNPKFARYETRNLQDYYGMGKHGKPGSQKNLPFKSNVGYGKSTLGINPEDKGPDVFKSYALPVLKSKSGDTGSYYEFRGDRINIIDYKRANFGLNTNRVYEKEKNSGVPNVIPGTRDLVDFYFTSLVLSGHNYCPAEVIVFRATFDSVQDSHNPSWNAVKYMGRADPLYVYQGYERSISFGFTVHIGSRDEMKATWRKLNYLASWTAPEYRSTDGLIRGPMCRLNIGNLYRKMPGFISSLSYTFDNTNGYWETAGLKEDQDLIGKNKDITGPGALQLPKYIQVSVGFTPVGVYRPEKNGVMYSLYDDTGVDVENGLIPIGENKVNYFRTFDDKPMNHEDNIRGVTSPVTNVTKVLTDDEIQKQFDQDRGQLPTNEQILASTAGGGTTSGNQIDVPDDLKPSGFEMGP